MTHRLGDFEAGSPETDFDALVAELDLDDTEHADVAVTHETGWSLSAFAGGRLVLEDVETDGPRGHIVTSRPHVLALFKALAAGDLATLEAEPWQPGYGE